MAHILNLENLPSEPVEVNLLVREEEYDRSIVSMLSRGNVSLQCGQYITADEIDSEIEHFKTVRFAM